LRSSPPLGADSVVSTRGLQVGPNHSRSLAIKRVHVTLAVLVCISDVNLLRFSEYADLGQTRGFRLIFPYFFKL
jgi:hypothetical protein